MTIGSQQHKQEFLDSLKKEAAENVWKNELHILRLSEELAIAQSELDKLQEQLKSKGKPPANAEKKQEFVLERSIEHKKREIAEVEEMKRYNSYLLNDLIPRYEQQ